MAIPQWRWRKMEDSTPLDEVIRALNTQLLHLSGVVSVNANAANRPVVTGSKANGAALASLLAALSTAGIITDNTTA